MNEHDKKIEKVLESIKDGYDSLEKIESRLEEIRKERSELIFENNINLSVNKEK